MAIVKITPAGESITCKAGENAKFQFNISNATGKTLNYGIQLKVDDGNVDWLSIEGDIERTLDTASSTTIDINAAPPADLLDKKDGNKRFNFKLRIYDVKNPENVENSATVSVEVVPAAAPKKSSFPWWIIVAILAVIIIVTFLVIKLTGSEGEEKKYTLVNTLSWANRNLKFSNIQLNGSNAQEISVRPGDTVDVTMNWALKVDNTSVYCPGCIVQFYMGVQDQGEKCYVSTIMPGGSTRSGRLNYRFVAPAEKGTYIVNNANSLQFSCKDINIKENTDQALAAIHVK